MKLKSAVSGQFDYNRARSPRPRPLERHFASSPLLFSVAPNPLNRFRFIQASFFPHLVVILKSFFFSLSPLSTDCGDYDVHFPVGSPRPLVRSDS